MTVAVAEAANESLDALLERWIRGDREAGGEICRRYYDRALRFAMRITGRETDAEDLAQQAMAEGLEGLRKGTRPDRFTNWLLGIVRNSASREWIRDRRERGDAGAAGIGKESPRAGPPTQFVGEEMDAVLRSALERLPAEDRDVLRVRVQERLGREEAAEELGIRLWQLDHRQARALAELRTELSRHFTTLVLTGPSGPVTLGAIETLRPSFRRAVELRHLEEKSPEAVAAELGVPLRTVAARLRHAYEKLGFGPDADFGPARRAYRERRR